MRNTEHNESPDRQGESCFTNTEKIVQAVATGLRSRGVDVEVIHADQAPNTADADLLVIGSPTYNLGLPKPSSRQQAQDKGGHPQTAGVAEWLTSLPRLLQLEVEHHPCG